MAAAQKSRILIFIVAYHAEQHIESVLERIPADVRNSDRYHILCIDDASADSSARTAANWARKHGTGNITVLRNPVNQGYGGNQKLGYRYAVDNGFDLVIMVHGDGQYAPELVPNFVELWEKTDADVLLGSRMHSLASARKGGMPLYKIVGNRVLTTFQNVVTGQNLSEYHTGYRAYSTRFLASVPFEINTNDFHFDTEILLQSFHARAKVVELPIPTYYGDEICRVNGMRYAKDVAIATLQYRLHSIGMFCTLKYRNIRSRVYDMKADQQYTAHARTLELIKKHAPERVLDIGCGNGWIATQCPETNVTGIDKVVPATSGGMTGFLQVDLDKEPVPVSVFDHDMVLMLDTIEEISEPEKFLLYLRNQAGTDFDLKNPPRIVISTPNVAFIAMRLNLLLGRFTYSERGILESSHKRLFTKASFQRLLEDCGYQVEEMIPVVPPFERVLNSKEWGRALSSLCQPLTSLMPSLFAFQFLAVARPKPGVAQLLEKGEEYLRPEQEITGKLAAANEPAVF